MKWFEFEVWFKTLGLKDYYPFSKDQLKLAYIEGFNTCRDKWGGVDYEMTLAEFADNDDTK